MICQKKAQEIALKNGTPHVLSHSGYRKLEQSLMEEKMQSRQGTGFEIDTGVTSPPSPPLRHVKWKRARIKKSGAFSSEQSKIVSKNCKLFLSSFAFILKH